MATVKLNGRTPEAQVFRAKRVIKAARELASSGGYDAVQMREISRLVPISLSTLYRYYASKDELISAAIRTELGLLRDDLHRRPPRRRAPAGRAGEVLVRAFHAMVRDPGFAHAAMSVLNAPVSFSDAAGRSAAGNARPAGEDTNEFVEITAELAWGAGHGCTPTELRTLHMLVTLWTGSVIDWLNGRVRVEEVERRLRLGAARLLHDAPEPGELDAP